MGAVFSFTETLILRLEPASAANAQNRHLLAKHSFLGVNTLSGASWTGRGRHRVPDTARIVVFVDPNFAQYCAYMANVRQRRGCCEEFAVATGDSFPNHLETDVNAMYLFHGTSPQAADLIARSDFRMDLAGSAVGTMFGPGLYLAEHASKADEYAQEGDGIFMGQYALIVCRAIAGRVYATQEKGNFADKVASGEYDSVCGDRLAAVGTFREMVFYDKAAVCPEYIVVYIRTYEQRPHVDDDVPAAATPWGCIPSMLKAPIFQIHEESIAIPLLVSAHHFISPPMGRVGE